MHLILQPSLQENNQALKNTLNVFGPSSHGPNTNMALTMGNNNSQNITPGAQINLGNIGDRVNSPTASGGGSGPNQLNAVQSPRRSERYICNISNKTLSACRCLVIQ